MDNLIKLDVGICDFNAPYEPIRQLLASMPNDEAVGICLAINRTMNWLLSMKKDTHSLYFANSQKLADIIGCVYVYEVLGVPYGNEGLDNDSKKKRGKPISITSKNSKTTKI